MVLVYWNSSYGSKKTKLLAHSLWRLLKQWRVEKLVVMLVVVRILVPLKGLEKIAITILMMMVMVCEGLRSPWIRQGELETSVRFGH